MPEPTPVEVIREALDAAEPSAVERFAALRAVASLEAELATQGKRIHDAVRDSFERRLSALDRVASKERHQRMSMENNLNKARATRAASQNRLILASRQIARLQAELAEAREGQEYLRQSLVWARQYLPGDKHVTIDIDEWLSRHSPAEGPPE